MASMRFLHKGFGLEKENKKIEEEKERERKKEKQKKIINSLIIFI